MVNLKYVYDGKKFGKSNSNIGRIYFKKYSENLASYSGLGKL